MKRAAVPLAGLVILVVMLAGAYAMGAYVPAGAPRIIPVWRTGGDGRALEAVEVVGVRPAVLRGVRSLAATDTAWGAALRIVVEQPLPSTPTPDVIGRYSVRPDRIRFDPRFPFAPGVRYRVELDARALEALADVTPGADPPRVTHLLAIPAAPAAPRTRVVAVHPTADRLPSNMLRWYVEFSSPMEPGVAHEHVHLLDEAGRPVRNAFLQVGEELWDPGRKRLTLLFDPGRVKRGVRANLEMGAPLAPGRRYRLVVDAAWRDAAGAPLASGFEKEFDVGSFDGASPDPTRWRLTVPRAGTRVPLRVEFDEALDHALARRMLSVERRGWMVEGRVELRDDDSTWIFLPTSAWGPGVYLLRVDAALEDLAGNNVARVFDADRVGGAPSAEEAARTGASRTIEFRVAP